MGTNYYLKKRNGGVWRVPKSGLGPALERVCSELAEAGEKTATFDLRECVEEVRELHVGKSSAGWHFALCVYPTLGVYGLTDYERLMKDGGVYAVDEYGEEISGSELIDRIADRKANTPATAEEAESNGTDLGVNGLFAHRSGIWDPRGESKWDGFAPKFYSYYRTDGSYDLTPEWDFS